MSKPDIYEQGLLDLTSILEGLGYGETLVDMDKQLKEMLVDLHTHVGKYGGKAKAEFSLKMVFEEHGDGELKITPTWQTKSPKKPVKPTSAFVSITDAAGVHFANPRQPQLPMGQPGAISTLPKSAQ